MDGGVAAGVEFLTQDGWQTADKLQPGQQILQAVVSGPDAWPPLPLVWSKITDMDTVAAENVLHLRRCRNRGRVELDLKLSPAQPLHVYRGKRWMREPALQTSRKLSQLPVCGIYEQSVSRLKTCQVQLLAWCMTQGNWEALQCRTGHIVPVLNMLRDCECTYRMEACNSRAAIIELRRPHPKSPPVDWLKRFLRTPGQPTDKCRQLARHELLDLIESAMDACDPITGNNLIRVGSFRVNANSPAVASFLQEAGCMTEHCTELYSPDRNRPLCSVLFTPRPGGCLQVAYTNWTTCTYTGRLWQIRCEHCPVVRSERTTAIIGSC